MKCCKQGQRGPTGQTGPKGKRGLQGATGPQGPAGTISTAEATANTPQTITGAQSDIVITGASLPLAAGTYVAMFECDVLNNIDNSTGTYTFEVNGTPVGNPRAYGPGVGGYFRDMKKFVINELIVSAGVGTLTVSITQSLGEIVLNRFSLITLKTA